MSSQAVARAMYPPSAEAYSVTVAASEREIRGLAQRSERLLRHQPSGAKPEFFLASICQRKWKARIASVAFGDEIVGFVNAKERRLAGFGTGVLYADGSATPIVAAEQPHREQVFVAGLSALLNLPGVRGLRLILPSQAKEIQLLQRLCGPSMHLDVSFSSAQTHDAISLPETYNGFLQILGRETRYNFRRYRRHFEELGGEYVREASLEEFENAAIRLRKKSRIPTRSGRLERVLKMLRAADRPLVTGLRDREGRWLSILAGWCESDRVVLLAQMNNDLDHPHSSLSVVLRGYLIETLIRQGTRDLIFWAGSGALQQYIRPIAATAVYVDRQDRSWRLLRRAYTLMRPGLPRGLCTVTDWVALPPTSHTA